MEKQEVTSGKAEQTSISLKKRESQFMSWLESDVSLPSNIETITVLILRLLGIELKTIYAIENEKLIHQYITLMIDNQSPLDFVNKQSCRVIIDVRQKRIEKVIETC